MKSWLGERVLRGWFEVWGKGAAGGALVVSDDKGVVVVVGAIGEVVWMSMSGGCSDIRACT